jgi:transcriptional regulator with XRE-family HTH domain
MRRKRLKDDRLRAAYQAGGFASWHQLAKVAEVSHPTLSRLVNGRIEAVNAATLERLAKALQVPPEWLTGERKDLPYVPEWDQRRRRGEGPSNWERPTADHVRWSWLMLAAEAAIRRDLRDWYGEEAGDAYDSWGRGLLSLFTRLGSSMAWRSVTLVRSPKGSERSLWECDESPSENWLKHILEPWFTGWAYLNADVLRGVFHALLAEADVQLLGSKIHDADARHALERYAVAYREFVEEPMFERLGPPEDD